MLLVNSHYWASAVKFRQGAAVVIHFVIEQNRGGIGEEPGIARLDWCLPGISVFGAIRGSAAPGIGGTTPQSAVGVGERVPSRAS
jgi:hypothetical protein